MLFTVYHGTVLRIKRKEKIASLVIPHFQENLPAVLYRAMPDDTTLKIHTRCEHGKAHSHRLEVQNIYDTCKRHRKTTTILQDFASKDCSRMDACIWQSILPVISSCNAQQNSPC